VKLIFAGTPEFAAVALAKLHAAGHDIRLVLTQPDRPAGRGMKLQASAVKQFALAHGIVVAQPRGLRLDGKYGDDAREAQRLLAESGAEAMVVAAYGLILPAWVLALPPRGCLNIHGSLLPRWRGAAPIHRAIEAGDKETGITIMQMDEGLDTGDMLLMEAEAIRPDDSTATLHDRLAELGGRLIVEAISRLDDLKPRQQPEEGVTYAAKILKAEAAVDWTAPAAVIERRLRAFDPFPGATGLLDGETVKLWRAEVADGRGTPGQVQDVSGGAITVATGEGTLRLLELQRPGGKRQPAAQFIAADPALVGKVFA
jgi:methionyl-tRNA formyltransferase